MLNKKYLKDYLRGLWEHQDFNRLGRGGQGGGMGMRGNSDRKPSPVAAHELVYGRPAPAGMRGQYPGNYETKMWDGFKVDVHLEDKWLNDLKKIQNIEMRASCEGHDKQWVTFIAFRVLPTRDNDVKYLERIKKSLNKINMKCDYQTGQQGRPRFIVAAKLWYGQPGWKEFWTNLAYNVKKAVR